MHNLGLTRSVIKPDHLLQTPDTFVRTALPGMIDASAVIHVAPASGARFLQYTAEIEAQGKLSGATMQCFMYVLQGRIELDVDGQRSPLTSGSYAYIPPGTTYHVKAQTQSQVAVIEKEYIPLSGKLAPTLFIGRESAVAASPLLGDPDLMVKSLMPDDLSFDFAVNTMTYQPGAALSMVEVHVMEHGLLMLEGGGIYRLNDCWYPVNAGDFIWMAPFCPQWFGALGKQAAKYLIYKDWNRSPLG